MNIDMSNLFSESLIWIPPVFIIIYNIYNFVSASKTEQLLENRKLRPFRDLYKHLITCFFLFSFSTLLPAININNHNLLVNIIVYSTTALFFINFIFYILSNIKQYPKIKKLRKQINEHKIIRVTFPLHLVLLIIQFGIINSLIYYMIKTNYNLHSIHVYRILFDLISVNSAYLIYIPITALFSYFFFYAYLTPLQKYKRKETYKVYFDIYLENGQILNNLQLDEIFNSYFVFSKGNESEAKHIISKDKILYLKSHNGSGNITVK